MMYLGKRVLNPNALDFSKEEKNDQFNLPSLTIDGDY